MEKSISKADAKKLQAAIDSGHVSGDNLEMMKAKLKEYNDSGSGGRGKSSGYKAGHQKSKAASKGMSKEDYEGAVVKRLAKIIGCDDKKAVDLVKKYDSYVAKKREEGSHPSRCATGIDAKNRPSRKGKDDNLDKDLSDCEEIVRENRKANRKEPVKHTSNTKLKSHIHGIANVCLEKIGDDADKIKELQAYLAKVEMHIRTTFLGLKKESLNDETKDKLKDAASKAA